MNMSKAILILPVLLVNTCLAFATEADWPNSPSAVFRTGGTLVLTEDTDVTYDSIRVENGFRIKTNGHKLKLHVRETLKVEGLFRIYSYDADDLPSVSGTPGKNSHGTSWNRGPGTSGRRPPRNGGDGLPGIAGAQGEKGFNAALLRLVFAQNAEIAGSITISNHGGRGGSGGDGGDGGDGGNGEQGGRGIPATIGCKHGPTSGGKGGNAGSGGAPGVGGSGGNGGDVTIVYPTSLKSSIESFTINLEQGSLGVQGNTGLPGRPGLGGYGGRGSTGCHGRETERMGPNGGAGGQSSQSAGKPSPGEPGELDLIEL